MKIMVVLAFMLLFLSPAKAEDPCAGRNPLYCAPQPGPVIVEKIRTKPSGSITTTTDTVISQDGRALVIIRGRDHNTRPPLGSREKGNQ